MMLASSTRLLLGLTVLTIVTGAAESENTTPPALSTPESSTLSAAREVVSKNNGTQKNTTVVSGKDGSKKALDLPEIALQANTTASGVAATSLNGSEGSKEAVDLENTAPQTNATASDVAVKSSNEKDGSKKALDLPKIALQANTTASGVAATSLNGTDGSKKAPDLQKSASQTNTTASGVAAKSLNGKDGSKKAADLPKIAPKANVTALGVAAKSLNGTEGSSSGRALGTQTPGNSTNGLKDRIAFPEIESGARSFDPNSTTPSTIKGTQAQSMELRPTAGVNSPNWRKDESESGKDSTPILSASRSLEANRINSTLPDVIRTVCSNAIERGEEQNMGFEKRHQSKQSVSKPSPRKQSPRKQSQRKQSQTTVQSPSSRAIQRLLKEITELRKDLKNMYSEYRRVTELNRQSCAPLESDRIIQAMKVLLLALNLGHKDQTNGCYDCQMPDNSYDYPPEQYSQ